MEGDEANEYEQIIRKMPSLEGKEERRGERNRTGVKKEETRWREGIRRKSLSVFMFLGVCSNPVRRHWAVLADASRNQISHPHPSWAIFLILCRDCYWMDKRTRQAYGICLLYQFPPPSATPHPVASLSFSFCMLNLEPDFLSRSQWGSRAIIVGVARIPRPKYWERCFRF